MIGGAQYIRTHGGRAETSLSVTDEFQGRGIGSILLGQLAEAAAVMTSPCSRPTSSPRTTR